MFMDRLKAKFNTNEPIFTNEILNLFCDYSRAYVFRMINEAKDSGELICFDTGVYYIPTKTIIGVSTITAEDVVRKKYIGYKNNVYGLYGGLNLQNMFSLTTQMPNTLEIVSNYETMRCRTTVIDGRKVILRKSRCKINPKNVGAYTVLQLLSEIKDLSDVDESVKQSLSKYMRENSVTVRDLVALAEVFPAKTTKNLLYSGVLNDFI